MATQRQGARVRRRGRPRRPDDDPRRRAVRARPRAGRRTTCCSRRSCAARSTASPTTRGARATTSPRRARRTGRSRRRDADGRYALRRRSTSRIDVQLDAARRTSTDDLIAKAERDCFVGASLTLKPEYDVARVLTTVEAARARFTALAAAARVLRRPGRHAGARLGDRRDRGLPARGEREPRRRVRDLAGDRTRWSTHAHATAARASSNATADEVAFGANMTTLNFALSRAASREWRAGDEIVCTQLDHDGNVAPWLELAHDRGLDVRFADVDDECRLDLDHLRSLLNERTRVVAFPWASNAVGTVTPVAEIAAARARRGRARVGRRRALRAARPDRRRRPPARTSLLCSPYKFYGPHLGLAFGRRELLESWRPYKVRPAADQPGRPPLRDRARSRTSCSRASSPRSSTSTTSAGSSSHEHERALGQQFLDGLPDGVDAARRPDDGRPRADVRDHARVVSPAGGGGAARRARLRGLARQLLRGRDHEAPRPATTARSASASSTTTPRTRCDACSAALGCVLGVRIGRAGRLGAAASRARGGSGRGRCRAPRPPRASAGGSGRCRRPDAASGRASRRTPSASSAATASAARSAARPSPSSTYARAPARRPRRGSRAGAARSRTRSAATHAPSRSLSTASCAVGQSRPAPATSTRSGCARAPAARRAPPRPRPAATRCPRRAARRSPRPRRCSSPCGTTTARARGVQTITSSASSASGERRLAGDEPDVAAERARRLERQRRRRPRARRRRGRRPRGGRAPPRAPAPRGRRSARRGTTCRSRCGRRDAPPGSRRSVGTSRSHSGCAKTARRVSPGIPPSIPSPR